jgi:ABC-2 type transporter
VDRISPFDCGPANDWNRRKAALENRPRPAAPAGHPVPRRADQRARPQTRNQVWQFIRALCRDERVTVFFTTHYMEEAERVADRIAVIDHGRIVAEGTAAALRQRPAHPPLLPLALLFMTLIAVMCTAIGTAVGSVLQDMQGFQLIMNFIVLPLFFFSSALFPVPDLPGAVRLNPLSYGVDGLRGALSGGGFVFGIATDFVVLGGLVAILLAIGAWLFSKIEV